MGRRARSLWSRTDGSGEASSTLAYVETDEGLEALREAHILARKAEATLRVLTAVRRAPARSRGRRRIRRGRPARTWRARTSCEPRTRCVRHSAAGRR